MVTSPGGKSIEHKHTQTLAYIYIYRERASPPKPRPATVYVQMLKLAFCYEMSHDGTSGAQLSVGAEMEAYDMIKQPYK